MKALLPLLHYRDQLLLSLLLTGLQLPGPVLDWGYFLSFTVLHKEQGGQGAIIRDNGVRKQAGCREQRAESREQGSGRWIMEFRECRTQGTRTKVSKEVKGGECSPDLDDTVIGNGVGDSEQRESQEAEAVGEQVVLVLE